MDDRAAGFFPDSAVLNFLFVSCFGLSKPSHLVAADMARGAALAPAGLTGANLLGFTTQHAALGEYATSAHSVSSSRIKESGRIYTRRPESWSKIAPEEAAILDFLRSRGSLSELSPEETKQRLLDLLRIDGRFERLAAVSGDEPPRVRAILGAAGRELERPAQELQSLKDQLNPTSKFDFGILSVLRYAKEWQAK